MLDWRQPETESGHAALRTMRRIAPYLCDYGVAYASGVQLLADGRYADAVRQFEIARVALGRVSPGESSTLHRAACDGSALARAFLGLRKRLRESGSRHGAASARALALFVGFVRRRVGGVGSAVLVRAVEDWAIESTVTDSSIIVGLVVLLARHWMDTANGSVAEFVDRLRCCAPGFFALSRRALAENYLVETPSAPAVKQLSWSVGFLLKNWQHDPANSVLTSIEHDLLAAEDRGVRIGGSGVVGLLSPSSISREFDAGLLAEGVRIFGSAGRAGSRAQIEFQMSGSMGGSEILWHRARYRVELGGRRSREGLLVRVCGTPNAMLEDRAVLAGSSDRPTNGEGNAFTSVGLLREGVPIEARFVGSSAEANEVRALIRMAAACDLPVLVVGPSGVGKGLVADCIHENSARSDRELVRVNAAAIPDSLLEAELFGSAKGSFTGATEDRVGIFGELNNAGLFFDEIDSISPRMQATLLRVLDGGEYRRVGETRLRRARFRLICASPPQIFPRIRAHEFRQDLYFRIGGIVIDVPPLSARLNDGIEIVEAWAGSRGLHLVGEWKELVVGFEWPGNVRQLLQTMEVAASLGCEGAVTAEGLAEAMRMSGGLERRRSENAGDSRLKRRLVLERLPERFQVRHVIEQTGQSRRTAQRVLADLVGSGVLARHGAGRATTYSVNLRDQRADGSA